MNVKRSAGNLFHHRSARVCYDIDSAPVATGVTSRLISKQAPAGASKLAVDILRDPRRPSVRIMPYEVRLLTGDYGDDPVIVYEGTNEGEDRYGTVITMAGWNTDSYMRSAMKPGSQEPGGVVQPFHMYDALPVGRTFKLEIKAKRMLFHVRFAVEYCEFNGIAYRMVRDGFMSGCSVGFIPLTGEEYESTTVTGWYADKTRYLTQELLELSITPVGANRDALANMLSKRTVTPNEVEHFHLDRLFGPADSPLAISTRGIAVPKRKTDTVPWYEDHRSVEDIARVAVVPTAEERAAASEVPVEQNPYVQSLLTAANLSDEVCDLITNVLIGYGVTFDDNDDPVQNHVSKRSLRRSLVTTMFAAIKRESKVLSSANEADLQAAIDHLTSMMDRHKASKKKEDEAPAPVVASILAVNVDSIIGRVVSGKTTLTAGGDSSTNTAEGAEGSRVLQQLAARSDDVLSLIFRPAAGTT
jgi:hypothetical protein